MIVELGRRRWLPSAGAIVVVALTMGAATSASGIATQGHSAAIHGNPAGTGAPFAQSSPLSPSKVTGGTLKVGVAGDVDYLDPARSYYSFSWDIHQLINRTLL